MSEVSRQRPSRENFVRTSDVRDYVAGNLEARGTGLGARLSSSLFGFGGGVNRGGRFSNADVYDGNNNFSFNNGFILGANRSYGNSGRVAAETTNKRFAKDAQKWALGMDVAGFMGSMIQGFYGMFNQPDTIYVNSAWGGAPSNGARIVGY